MHLDYIENAVWGQCSYYQ